MSEIQYTIRSIPAPLDASLRQQSALSGKSLNKVLIETLAKGAGLATAHEFDDLDWFIGKKSLDSSFSRDIEWLDSLPRDL